MTLMLIALALLSTPSEERVAGFICTATDGTAKRLNIDLKRHRYDAGEGVKKIDAITDTKITLAGPNPYLVFNTTGMGPIISSLTLDRASLILTDETRVPERNVNRVTQYQCQIGAPIDFRAGQKF